MNHNELRRTLVEQKGDMIRTVAENVNGTGWVQVDTQNREFTIALYAEDRDEAEGAADGINTYLDEFGVSGEVEVSDRGDFNMVGRF